MLASEHKVREAKDTAVHGEVLVQPMVKSGSYLRHALIGRVGQQPLLTPGPPGRFELIPLALISAAEMQDPPTGLDRYLSQGRKRQDVVTEELRRPGCRRLVPASVPKEGASTGSNDMR
jgi:hypothetical protein